MTTSYPLPSPNTYTRLPFPDKLMWIRRLDAMENVIGLKHDVSHVRKAWAETERPRGKGRTR